MNGLIIAFTVALNTRVLLIPIVWCGDGLVLAFVVVWILLGIYMLNLYLARRGLVQERESLRLVK